AVIAAVVGWMTGAGATAFMRWAGQSQVSSTLRPDACVGASGTVLLPVAPGARGRIRVALEGQMIDFDAETEDEHELCASEPVVVYALRDDGVALVTSAVPNRSGGGPAPLDGGAPLLLPPDEEVGAAVSGPKLTQP